MKIGVIGLGYWGPNILRNLLSLDNVRVFAYDKDINRMEKIKRFYPSAVYVNSFGELLSNVDAVMIVTPVETHYELAKAALLKNKDVFVEKPLAISTKEAEELINLAEQRSRILMVGHTFLFNPAVRKVKDLIESGELGDIYYISMTRVNLGIHRKDCNVIWDLASHDLSILYYWLEDEVEKVKAIGDDFSMKNGNIEVAFINLQFKKGAIANIHVSWLAPNKVRNTIVVGSKKMVVYDDTNPQEKIKIYDAGIDILEEPKTFGEFLLTYRTGDIISPRIPAEEPLRLEVKHFLECIQSRKRPLTDAQEGLKIVKTLERIEKALYN